MTQLLIALSFVATSGCAHADDGDKATDTAKQLEAKVEAVAADVDRLNVAVEKLAVAVETVHPELAEGQEKPTKPAPPAKEAKASE